MAELWTPTQAAYYLVPNGPCNSPEHAHHLISCWIEDGILSSWCQLGDGELRPIDPRDLKERQAGEYELKWLTWSKLPREGGFIGFVVDAAEVRRLCPPQQTQQTPTNRGGRPPGEWDMFYCEVVALALGKDGLPDKKADLNRYMADWCAANIRGHRAPGPDAIEKKVRELYRFIEGKGMTPSGGRLR
jgi:hypothetical protein